MVCWPGDTLLSQFDALSGWEHDIDELDVGHLGEHEFGLVAESGLRTGAGKEIQSCLKSGRWSREWRG